MDRIVREEVAEPTKTKLCGLIEALGYFTQSVQYKTEMIDNRFDALRDGNCT
jgi:hypothetical protein